MRSTNARRYGGEAPHSAVCPFLGLATFDADHAEYFFGRERLVAELVARLVGSPLVAVIGPSGSGKSSTVRAGLLPALAGGVLPGSERWPRALMRPGEHPSGQLERALPEPAEHAVLVIDQFEEVFTVCRDEDERSAFLDAIVELAEDSERSVQVVVAMRADFYGHCAANDRLARLVGANQVLVGPMRRDELRHAIEEPARRAGLQVEPSLTDALIADVLDQPGGLPLLSAALLEQWREREGRVMRRAAYERTGGVRGAVGRLAERTYASLSEPERRAARGILLRLADAGDHEAAFVRRRMPLDEPDRDEHTAAALGALIDSRLVTADGETLEVAHEALLREWPWLRGWLEEDADGRRLHQHLTNASRDWQAGGRDSGELYRGARLASTLDWVAGHEADLNELERDFLAESCAEAEQESEHQRRTNRRLRAVLAGLAALPALAVVAGIVALNQRGEARTHIRDVRSGKLVQRLDTGDYSRSVAFSPDGELLFVGQFDGRGHLVSTKSWKPVGRPLEGHTERITFPEFSRDGRTLVTAAADVTVVLWDVETQKALGSPLRLASNTFASAALSPDGSRLFAVSTRGPGISFDMSPEAWKRHACLVAGRELTAAEWEDALPGRPYQAVCSG
jgi:conflict system STAND superfamily ATPase/WD40 domain-containing protein